MRTKVEYRTTQKEVYKRFKQKHPEANIDFNTWASVIYNFNYAFRDYVLETGYKCKFIHGFGDFSIVKWKPVPLKTVDGEEFVALSIDWKKTKAAGKRIYHFNYDTEGYRFRWKWFRKNARIKDTALWNFKPSRVSSRLLKHYIKIADYQHKYLNWK